MTVEMAHTPMPTHGGAFCDEVPSKPKRNVFAALRRGLACRCPCCGEGRLFRAYLKVKDRCPVCETELFHHRADDAPPYVTILVVAHVVGALMLAADEFAPNLPIVYDVLIWPALTLGLCLALLPPFKGALIAVQWALRMHGFETAAEARCHG